MNRKYYVIQDSDGRWAALPLLDPEDPDGEPVIPGKFLAQEEAVGWIAYMGFERVDPPATVS